MKSFITLVTLAFSVSLHAGTFSKRYLVAELDDTPAFEVTQRYVDHGSFTTLTLVIDDPSGPLMQVHLTANYAERKTSARYDLLRGDRGNLTVVLDLPFASTTREARIQEIRTRPELSTEPVPVTVRSSSGRSISALDSDWRAAGTRTTHQARARQVAGDEMLAALMEISKLGGLPPFAELRQTLGYLLDDEALVRHARGLKLAEVDLGCEFDDRGGVRCKQ